MTVTTATSRIEYAGDGSTTAFSVPFYFLANGDLKVYQADTLKTITTHYTVTGAGNPAGGTVTFVAAPGSSDDVVIYRDPAITQSTDYVENDPFPAESHETALDRLTMIAQRSRDLLTRAVRLPDSEADAASMTLPEKASRLSHVIGFDTLGNLTTYTAQAGTSLIDLAASTGSDLIGFIQSGTGAVLRTAQDKMRESVTVQDFGASSSVSASVNTAAFNNALASGAKVVEVINDGGTYLIDGTITVPSGVTLIGRGLPVIKAADGAFPSGGYVFQLSSATNSVIDGVKIDANRQNNGASMYGIYGSLCVGCSVMGCYIINFEYGIFFLGGNTLRISGNTVDDGVYYGITVKLNDKTADCYNIVITQNECKNITTGGTGGAVDGQGIIVYGVTDLLSANYKNITDVIVSTNICHTNGRGGISIVAVSNFIIADNNCYDNLNNTDLACGILISEAANNGSITGNTCNNNYDAGILLDVVDQENNRFPYGRLSVTGNTCAANIQAGIKVNSMPFSTITGNHIDGRRLGTNTQYGIFFSKGGFNNVSDNNISYCSVNGIRIAGLVGASAPDQENIVIANNIISNIVAAGSEENSAIYATYWTNVKVQGNQLVSNTQDLTIKSTCSKTTLLQNNFTSNVYTDTSASILRWDDEFRTTIGSANWLSTEFAGSGEPVMTLTAGFVLPHFGLGWLPVEAATNVTSNLTTPIAAGYNGQRLLIINRNAATITIKGGGNAVNIGGADVVLAYHEKVEYTFNEGAWFQTTAKVSA